MVPIICEKLLKIYRKQDKTALEDEGKFPVEDYVLSSIETAESAIPLKLLFKDLIVNYFIFNKKEARIFITGKKFRVWKYQIKNGL